MDKGQFTSILITAVALIKHSIRRTGLFQLMVLLAREWCHPQWVGLPTPVKITKAFPYSHAPRHLPLVRILSKLHPTVTC